ncbi:MAG: FeoB-associated Cys-rich membrane protein [Bacteroidales bacterium]|nr:FeoB-associated Cys-rich membrane protein [Bacteroidales bacterium]
MEKKDIIIFAAMLLLVGLSLYRRYMKKKSDAGGVTANKPIQKNSLSEQPDDYEPYSERKQPR